MRSFLNATGCGITMYFIIEHKPTWLIVLSTVMDVWGILDQIEAKK